MPTLNLNMEDPYKEVEQEGSTLNLDTPDPSLPQIQTFNREDDKRNFFDSMPLVFKQAYNESIGGIMYEMMEGKKRFNLGQAPDSLVRDIGAGILSFFASPTDMALTVGSLGAGSFAAKGALKASAGLIGRKGINETATKRAAILLSRKGNLNKKTAEGLVKDLVEQGAPQAFMLGAHDGLYDAAISTRDEMIQDGSINFEGIEKKSRGDILSQVVGNAKLSKFATGGALGLTAGAARGLRFAPGTKNLPIGGMGYEILSFAGLSPIAYEGRAPEFTDFAMAGGIIAGLKIPGAVKKGYKNVQDAKLLKEALDDEDLIREAGREEYFSAKKQRTGGTVLYEQGSGIRTDAGQADSLVGRRKVKKPEESGQPGKLEFEEKDTLLANFEVASSATIVEGSERVTAEGLTVQVNLKTGLKGTEIDTYQLDVKNTEKFFDFFVEADTPVLADISDSIDGAFSRASFEKKNPKFLKQTQISQYKNAVKEAGREGSEYTIDDIKRAIEDTADYIDRISGEDSSRVNLFRKALDEDNIIGFDIGKISSRERGLLTENLRAQKYINDFVLEAKKYDVNLMYSTSSQATKGEYSKFLRAISPAYSQIRDPFGKKLLRLLGNVDQGQRQKTSSRLYEFAKVLNIAKKTSKPVQKLYDSYIDGTGEVSAYKDYRAIRKLHQQQLQTGKPVVFGKNDGHTLFVKDLEEKAKRLGSSSIEGQALQNRVSFIKGMKNITDEVYSDAQTVLPNLEVFEVGYAPTVIRREILDILYDGNKNLKSKIDGVLTKLSNEKGAGKGIMDDGITGFEEPIRKELNNILESTLSRFGSSASSRQREFAKIFKAFKENVSSNGEKTFKDDFELYRLLNNQVQDKLLKPYKLLEKPKNKFASFANTDVDMVQMAFRNAMDGMIEKNMRSVYGDYFSGASKRIELARAFGPDGRLYRKLLNRIDPNNKMPLSTLPSILGEGKIPLMKQTEREAIDILKESFTGEINFGKNAQGGFTEAFQTIGNLQMMGKISFGFAVIPNFTQTLISTAVDLGPIDTIKTLFKLYGPNRDLALRERVGQSGATLLSTIEEMLNINPTLRTGVDRMTKSEAPWKSFLAGEMGTKGGIEYLTQKSAVVFSGINRVNQTIAAATAEENIKKLGRILRGDKVGTGLLDTIAPDARKKWARNKLGRLGLKEKDVMDNLDMILSGNYPPIEKQIVRGRKSLQMNPMKEKMLRSMQKFSQNSQLQRDFMLDPYLFNDPDLKPLFLFKRFGYRQATYIGEVLKREVADGNIMPILQLGVGGLAGGQFVMWSKEKLSDLISGEESYYSREERLNLLKDPEWNDFLNRIRSVGAFGTLTDIMTDENPLGALEFFLKPVVVDDIMRIGRSFEAFVGSMQTQYPDNWDVPFRKAAVIAAPVAGGISSRLTKRALSTEKMKKDQVRARKRDSVKAIKDSIISDDPVAAARIMNEYNSTYAERYPSLIIRPSDVSYSQILKDKVERLKKQREEVEYRP